VSAPGEGSAADGVPVTATGRAGVARAGGAGVLRDPTPVDALADGYLEAYAALDPEAATALGIPGHDHTLTDHSPAGHAARADLARRTLADLRRVAAPGRALDEVDRETVAALGERLESELALADAGEGLGEVNVAAAPLHSIRDVFDLMPTGGAEDRAVVARRLRAVPGAVAGYVAAIRHAADAGRPPARRQLLACAQQCRQVAASDGPFRQLADAVAGADAALAAELSAAADGAADAYRGLADFLAGDALALATDADAIGRERYAPRLRGHLGEDVDLDDAYAWGVEEVRRLHAEATALARTISDGGGITAAVKALDADPARLIHGPEAFRDWMQATSDEAVDALAGTWFDIPGPVRRLECRIAPTSTGAVYYTGPSEDLSRPGTMWWSVPEGLTAFATWQQRTIVYHEGVPGHHLQISAAVLAGDRLNRYRRLMCWVPGHGEGWALYAEGLMAELGYLADPGDRLGLLGSQLLRAARVVVDIGVHCGFAPPAEAGAAAWDADVAWRYLREHVPEPEPMLRYELDRYLGWAGQAPAYALGQRAWLELRDEARRRPGFDPVAWHARALGVGSMGLGPLRQVLGGGVGDGRGAGVGGDGSGAAGAP
jgi:uncharacterized protein (DUF885 family)